ncbi:hypothetical protein FB45DRAFT_1000521 [Roridomyces roridus]|uniref:Uncharacterized protein n=1 Tax=Roridomyces roridus TaxID=1738132 RepID=A0AAD7FTJ3_9AGAR|nr:hypothetical protein FB45DRAFT_1000521 [Roridomyces roridus]
MREDLGIRLNGLGDQHKIDSECVAALVTSSDGITVDTIALQKTTNPIEDLKKIQNASGAIIPDLALQCGWSTVFSRGPWNEMQNARQNPGCSSWVDMVMVVREGSGELGDHNQKRCKQVTHVSPLHQNCHLLIRRGGLSAFRSPLIQPAGYETAPATRPSGNVLVHIPLPFVPNLVLIIAEFDSFVALSYACKQTETVDGLMSMSPLRTQGIIPPSKLSVVATKLQKPFTPPRVFWEDVLERKGYRGPPRLRLLVLGELNSFYKRWRHFSNSLPYGTNPKPRASCLRMKALRRTNTFRRDLKTQEIIQPRKLSGLATKPQRQFTRVFQVGLLAPWPP